MQHTSRQKKRESQELQLEEAFDLLLSTVRGKSPLEVPLLTEIPQQLPANGSPFLLSYSFSNDNEKLEPTGDNSGVSGKEIKEPLDNNFSGQVIYWWSEAHLNRLGVAVTEEESEQRECFRRFFLISRSKNNSEEASAIEGLVDLVPAPCLIQGSSSSTDRRDFKEQSSEEMDPEMETEESIHRNVRVKGNLVVEGEIKVGSDESSNSLLWRCRSYRKLYPNEEIKMGDVVQLRLSENRVTLRLLNPTAGPLLVVISCNKSKNLFLCRFSGRAAVKVRGSVVGGELLFPSGRNDGSLTPESQQNQNRLAKEKSNELQLFAHVAVALSSVESDSNANAPFLVAAVLCWPHEFDWRHLRDKKSLGPLQDACLVWQLAKSAALANILFSIWTLSRFDDHSVHKFFIGVEILLQALDLMGLLNPISLADDSNCLALMAFRGFQLVSTALLLFIALAEESRMEWPLLLVCFFNFSASCLLLAASGLVMRCWMISAPNSLKKSSKIFRFLRAIEPFFNVVKLKLD